MDRLAWWARVHAVAESTRLSDFTTTNPSVTALVNKEVSHCNLKNHKY